MIKLKTDLYLASKSPRRKKMLRQLNLNFKTVSVDLREEILDGEHPVKTVKRLALQKLNLAKRKIEKGIIITADTIVVLNHEIIGKPENKSDAIKILNRLSGNKHLVYTGFAIFNSLNGKLIVDYEKTIVKFRKLFEKEIKDYVKTGSPMDKAGAYGIQDDFGAVFVEKINGCYYNVMGLPLAKLYINLLSIT